MKKMLEIFSKKASITALLVYTLIILISIVASMKLNVSGHIDFSMLPESNAYAKQASCFYETFPTEHAAIVSIAFTDKPLFSTESLSRVRHLTQAFKDSSLISHVYSITELDASNQNSALSEAFIDISSEESVLLAKEKIEDIVLLQSLILSSKGSAFLLYVVPERGTTADEFGLFFQKIRSQHQSEGIEISISSQLYFEHLNKKLIISDMLLIISIAAVVLITMYYIFTVNIAASLLLLANSLVVSLILMGLYPLFGISIDSMTIFLPLLLFSLTTAYSIHYYKTYEALSFSRTNTIKSIGGIIFLSMITTAVSYANLLFIHSTSVRTLGASLIIGLFVSVFSILWCISFLMEHIPAGKTRRWEQSLRNTKLPEGNARKILLLVFLLVFLGISSGAYWYSPDLLYREQYGKGFRSWTSLAEEEALFAAHNDHTMELELFIDTEREYGLVDFDTYSAVEFLTSRLRAMDETVLVISYTDITSYGNGILYGEHRDIPPISSAEIGETLEMVSAYQSNLPLYSFIDLNYQRTRILIRYSISDINDNRDIALIHRKVTNEIFDGAGLIEEAEVFLAGFPIFQQEVTTFSLDFLSRASLIFFILVFIMGFIILSSWKRGFLLLLPSLLAAIFYIGLNGWFRVPITVFNIFGLYTLLGISVDDTIYLLIHHKREKTLHPLKNSRDIVNTVFQHTGINILETTIIITAGISAALICGYSSVFYTVLLTTIALYFSTFVTLFIVPRFLYSNPSRKKEQ